MSYERHFKSPITITDTHTEGIKDLLEEKKRTTSKTLCILSMCRRTGESFPAGRYSGGEHDGIENWDSTRECKINRGDLGM